MAASCALPGVMAPAKLEMKGDDGEISLFEVDGVEWIDGSVQADLPFRRIGTMFNITNFIVCQVNFHVVPFMKREHHPTKNSTYWKVFSHLEWDIRSRVLSLSRLGLFPRFFGQDISKIFKQKYHGNLTIVPKMNMMQIVGVKALLNPTLQDMEHYLGEGARAVWPYCGLIKHLLAFEVVINKTIEKLEGSIARLEGKEKGRAGRNRPRSLSEAREVELLRNQVQILTEENLRLKKLSFGEGEGVGEGEGEGKREGEGKGEWKQVVRKRGSTTDVG